jgi:CHASE2 domain-containing sensor protein
MWETGDIRSKSSRNLWYTAHMTEPLSISTFIKSLVALLNRRSRFLWRLVIACVAAAILLFIAARLGLAHGQPWWDEYGLLLLLGTVVMAVFAAFQT